MTTVKLDDPQGIINSLQARVTQLENELERARDDRRTRSTHDISSYVHDAIRTLRKHSVILLDLADGSISQRASLESDPVLRHAYEQRWLLQTAPVSDEVKAAVRMAAKNGNERW